MNSLQSYKNNAHIKKLSVILTTILFLTSCSTITKSVVLGAGIGLAGGALLGSAIGQNSDHDAQNTATFTGAAIGSVLGGLVGYAGFKQQEKKLDQLPPQIKGFEKEQKIPMVTMPTVRKIWTPDKIDGNKFEAGHFIYILEKTSTWSNSNDK